MRPLALLERSVEPLRYESCHHTNVDDDFIIANRVLYFERHRSNQILEFVIFHALYRKSHTGYCLSLAESTITYTHFEIPIIVMFAKHLSNGKETAAIAVSVRPRDRQSRNFISAIGKFGGPSDCDRSADMHMFARGRSHRRTLATFPSLKTPYVDVALVNGSCVDGTN